MINVIDEVLNTGATDNKVKYRIIREDGSNEIVQINLETPVTTQGTPLNKVLFDSIQADLTFLTPIVRCLYRRRNKTKHKIFKSRLSTKICNNTRSKPFGCRIC